MEYTNILDCFLGRDSASQLKIIEKERFCAESHLLDILPILNDDECRLMALKYTYFPNVSSPMQPQILRTFKSDTYRFAAVRDHKMTFDMYKIIKTFTCDYDRLNAIKFILGETYPTKDTCWKTCNLLDWDISRMEALHIMEEYVGKIPCNVNIVWIDNGKMLN